MSIAGDKAKAEKRIEELEVKNRELESCIRGIIHAYGSTDADSEVDLARCIKSVIHTGRIHGFIEERVETKKKDK